MAAEKVDVAIRIRGLHKAYPAPLSAVGEVIVVLSGLDLDVRRGEFLTFFGPNGCGKSTLLHILAGVVAADQGDVRIDGEAPGQANIGFVFQNSQASLFPWRCNLDNAGWALELRGWPRKECRERARRFMGQMSISLPERGYPYQLSGGQQQLLSIVRALLAEPKVLLLDEPFNQLDFQSRMQMHLQVLDLWARTGTTIMFVSHDIEEALLLGDRTVLVSKRPASVLEILENPLPRPRNHDLLKTQDFFNLKARALEIFSRAIR